MKGTFHKIKAVNPLPDYRLSVQFEEGITKEYDVKPLFKKWDAFAIFKDHPKLFYNVEIDVGGYGVFWNDEIDLSCNELFKNGVTVEAYSERR